MLTKMENLPSNIIGIRADGKVTREDYEKILMPLLEEERAKGRRIRFLYQLAGDFSGFTAGALWNDFRVGVKYLRLFERFGVVSDVDWIRSATQIVGALMPCPSKAYRNDELPTAIEWLASEMAESKLKFELRNNGVLIIRPDGPLRREDFDQLSEVIDPWIETHDRLHGLVVCIKKFPGWENFGSFVRHIDFVKGHHRKIRRVALVVDGALPDLMAKFASHFVEAEVKHFQIPEENRAIEWAG